MNNIEHFIKDTLGWERFVKIPAPYFREHSLIGKIIRKLSTIGNHRTHKGHGLGISCKIVLPTYCQAHCPFCFNNITRKTQSHDWNLFFGNLERSLEYIIKHLKGRQVSFDITGNEPTFEVEQLQRTLFILKRFKIKYPNKISKIVLTTNGENLVELLTADDIISQQYGLDIINISIHTPHYLDRFDIFKTCDVPCNRELISINKFAHKLGIKTTSVKVVYKVEQDFEASISEFSKVSRSLGFDSTRVRLDYKGLKEARDQFYDNFKDLPIDVCPGLMSKHIVFGDYTTSMYLGVKDLTEFVLGSEIILDDDGIIYLDYEKRFPLTEDLSNLLNMIYWNPKIWWDENKLENGTDK